MVYQRQSLDEQSLDRFENSAIQGTLAVSGTLTALDGIFYGVTTPGSTRGD